MAFSFLPSMLCSQSSSGSGGSSSAQCSRRKALQLITAALSTSILLPASVKSQEGGLPPGAAQFSRVLSAQKQWDSLRDVLAKGDLTDEDWSNLRAYLRTVYSISGDMEFIAKPWTAELKEKEQEVIKRFRKTVKGMDKPAIAKDTAVFREQHAAVSGMFVEFFDVFAKATVSDIPDEL